MLHVFSEVDYLEKKILGLIFVTPISIKQDCNGMTCILSQLKVKEFIICVTARHRLSLKMFGQRVWVLNPTHTLH